MPGRFLFFLLILIFPGRTLFAQTLGFSIASGRKRVQIPIEIYNNLVVVPVVLNGALPLKFIVDSGVRTSILTQKAFGDILNLRYARKYTLSGPGNNQTVDAYVAPNVSLQLPGVTGTGHALLVLEDDYLELRNYLGTDVHGILGYELFSRFVVDINYSKKLMTLSVASSYKPRKGFNEAELNIEDTKPYIDAQVVQPNQKSKKVKLLVDSGASHGLILMPSSDSSIRIPDRSVSSVIGRGLGGAITGKVGRISGFKMGNYKLQDVIAYYPDPNSYFDSLRSIGSFRNGSIGGEMLSRFHVIYDYSREKIYFRKSSGFHKGFYYNLSGLTIKALGAHLNVFEVQDVRKGSVASEAGVLPQDQIVSINGIKSEVLSLNEINGLLNSKPHKRITLELLRNEESVRVTFRLQDQI